MHVLVHGHIYGLRESRQDHLHASTHANTYLLGIGSSTLSYFGSQKLLF